MKRTAAFFLFVVLFLAGAVSRSAAEVVQTDHVESELVSEVESIQPGKPFYVALRLKMEEHWHTYWLNPGDSGLATEVEWQLPNGFTAGPIEWPYPENIKAGPLVSYGYNNEVLLLTKITPPAALPAGKPVTLVGKASWLVCMEECIPGKAELKLTLPVSTDAPKPSSWAKAFTDTRAKLPLTGTDWKLQAAISNDKVIIRGTAPAWFKGQIGDATFFPEKGLVTEAAEPQTLKKLKTGFALEVKRATATQDVPTRIEGVLVTSDGWRGPGSEKALRIDVAVEPLAALGSLEPAASDSTQGQSGGFAVSTLLLVLGSAFIGGLILNLMPCVLPVLSIKILGFVQQGGEEHSKILKHGLAFTVGVLLSFWTLAGVLIGLRAGGEQLGWGFQMQSPPFVVVLAAIFFLFGLNLFGVFEVGIGLTRLGGASAANQAGLAGSFFSGALATISATPCTAPFMGSALGATLTLPTWATMLVFTALGIGMAFPYLLLSGAPGLMKFVPKPGAWMESFKQFMGFLLMGTVVFLIWVLANQIGTDGAALVLLALVVMAMGGWVLGRWGSLMNSGRTRLAAHLVAAALILGGCGFALTQAKTTATATTKATGTTGDGIAWEPFSPERVEQLRAEGKPVFVDFTATWCLSCKVNERVALSSADVQAKFKELGVVMIKADWTSRDETITKTLAQFGRNGVPLYVLYGRDPKQPPQVLPEVITPGIVLDALNKIG